MKNDLPKRLGIAALRTVFLFLAFQLLALLSRLIFKANIFDDTMLSPRAMGAWNSAFLFLIFESTVFAFHRHREDGRQGFLTTYCNSGMTGILKSAFSSPELYVECIGIALLSLVIPGAFDCVGMAFWGEGYGRGMVLAIVIPVLWALEIVAHLSVRGAWTTDAPKLHSAKAAEKKTPFAKTVGVVAFTASVYCAASLVIPWFIPFLVTLANFGAGTVGMLFVYIALVILAIVVGIVGLYAFRAVSKRKMFVTRLQKTCREQGISLSEIRKPRLSLFVRRSGADFTMQVGERSFACKLMGGIFPGSPMIFADTGEGIRQDVLCLFRTELLQINTRLDFRMEDCPAEFQKILIVVPVPKRIYASVDGSVPRPADTGEILGEYVLYNMTGFFGALERGHLGK